MKTTTITVTQLAENAINALTMSHRAPQAKIFDPVEDERKAKRAKVDIDKCIQEAQTEESRQFWEGQKKWQQEQAELDKQIEEGMIKHNAFIEKYGAVRTKAVEIADFDTAEGWINFIHTLVGEWWENPAISNERKSDAFTRINLLKGMFAEIR